MAGNDWSQHYKDCGLPLIYLAAIFSAVVWIFSLFNAVEFKRDVALYERTGRNYRCYGLGYGSLPGSSGDKRMADLVDVFDDSIAIFWGISDFGTSIYI